MVLENSWLTLEKAILANAPDVQRFEMRKAFYCGAFATLTEIFNITDTNVSEAEATKKMRELYMEASNFMSKLISSSDG